MSAVQSTPVWSILTLLSLYSSRIWICWLYSAQCEWCLKPRREWL